MFVFVIAPLVAMKKLVKTNVSRRIHKLEL